MRVTRYLLFLHPSLPLPPSHPPPSSIPPSLPSLLSQTLKNGDIELLKSQNHLSLVLKCASKEIDLTLLESSAAERKLEINTLVFSLWDSLQTTRARLEGNRNGELFSFIPRLSTNKCNCIFVYIVNLWKRTASLDLLVPKRIISRLLRRGQPLTVYEMISGRSHYI